MSACLRNVEAWASEICLYTADDSAWATWARQELDLSTLEGPLNSGGTLELAPLTPSLLSQHRHGTVGDGRSTNFWEDNWCRNELLAVTFPALFSHSNRQGASVHEALTLGIRRTLVTRLSRAAGAELVELQAMVSEIHLTSEQEQRTCPFVAADGVLRAGPLFYTRYFSKFVWRSQILRLANGARASEMPPQPKDQKHC
ncbi:hypothetical protein GQ55_1G090200 [Panicum hallii var. hallii]|uniref:Uncharacterized protein n=1 Tax=Panicum hallii var. hallii TaxID=1504633 RepID=A0A2T7F3U0_9POAL|nr:hypothetical protein GQ55_1G090200 [Panicum hallii var. hallii]